MGFLKEQVEALWGNAEALKPAVYLLVVNSCQINLPLKSELLHASYLEADDPLQQDSLPEAAVRFAASAETLRKQDIPVPNNKKNNLIFS